MKIIQMIVKSICDSFFSYSVMKENTNKISKKILITLEYDRDLGVLNFIKVCFRYQDKFETNILSFILVFTPCLSCPTLQDGTGQSTLFRSLNY